MREREGLTSDRVSRITFHASRFTPHSSLITFANRFLFKSI